MRRLSVPGCELEGIHYLRTLGNSDTIRNDAAGKRVVMIGGSYIASEVAASLTMLGSSCAMVMLEDSSAQPDVRRGGRPLLPRRASRNTGSRSTPTMSLTTSQGHEGRVTHVVTKRGSEIEADAVVVGVGVMPDVMLARAAGLELGERGGVLVDSRLQTPVPGIFAAGDIAEYESVVHGGRRIRVEHWDVAFNHGKTAALNMLGTDQPHDVVPYFFSDLADWASLEYVGPATDWDQEIVRGSFDSGEFSVWYVTGGRVAAAVSSAARTTLSTPAG